MKTSALASFIALPLLLAGCAGNKVIPKDYTAFSNASPKSLLIVPVVNHSNEVDAADLFMTTLAVPLSERGYYVFPTNASKKLMEAEGLGDPGLIHQTPTPDLARVFGTDAVMYVEVLDWKSNYQILSSSIDVEFLYTLKSGKDNSVLWQDQQRYVYSASSNSGNILADLLANAIRGAIDSTRRDFTPLAMQANLIVLTPAENGIPFGHRSPNLKLNQKLYPSNGSGRVSNATREALSAPGLTIPTAGDK
jgi:hypothetical protein